MFIVGHDACHGSLTPHAWLNAVLGRLAFLPSLHPFSLWAHGHNHVHHGFNNIRGLDYVWEPMSPEDWAAASPRERAFYRLFRHPLGVPLYYGWDIWLRRMALPRRAVLGEVRAVHLFDTTLVWLFLAVQAAAVIWLGARFGKGWAEAVLLGVVLPFLVWNALMSVIIFLHHMHPDVPWYATREDWKRGEGALRGTAHVRFPQPVGAALLHIMEHNAHHHQASVPFYNLPRLQRALAGSADLASWRWSPRAYLDICRRCQLYDYRRDRWVTFAEAEGVITSGAILGRN